MQKENSTEIKRQNIKQYLPNGIKQQLSVIPGKIFEKCFPVLPNQNRRKKLSKLSFYPALRPINLLHLCPITPKLL